METAKRLGITSGVGDNLFAPDKAITRQEMFTLLYSALKVTGNLPQVNTDKTLSDFTDAGQISSWANDTMKVLTEKGTVSGSGGMSNVADVLKGSSRQPRRPPERKWRRCCITCWGNRDILKNNHI